MALPKLPPPPQDPAALADWAKHLYEWLGRATIDGLATVDGKIVAKAGNIPPVPLIAQPQTSIPIGQQFSWNFLIGKNACDGYWVYKSSVANDSATASRYKFVGQSNDGGVYTFQDNTGQGVIAFYWVASINSAGESELVSAGGGTGSSLDPSQTKTTIRPSTSAGLGYLPASAAYDGNLNVAANAIITAGSF